MRKRFVIAAGRLSVLFLLSLAMLGTAFADDDTDPPGRVARVSLAEGSVSLQPAGVEDWAAAVVNRPLTTGDKLWTDQGSRAELDIGAAVIRLGDNTGFSFLSLDDNTAQMQVTAGTLLVHVRELLENQTYEIDTPNLAVLLGGPGEYRVDVNEAGDTTVVRVSDGQAEVTGGGETTPVNSQQMVTFTGTDHLSVYATTLGAPDGLDDWSMQRDRRSDQAQSRQYVADDVAGTQDLDDNGRWEDTPDYGYVWTPTTIAVGWAPYSVGHWAWVGPWGWTWVDAAPWGFAPFHYGRWARWHNSWCWVPGPRHIRPVYAPAMVAWVGGAHGGLSVAGGGVGWFPLGPREVYVPGYHVSDRYVRNINVTNTRIVNHTYITDVYRGRVSNIHYANSGIPGGVTAVPRNVFTSAQSVSGHRMHLPPGPGGRFTSTGAPPAISPGRQSVLGPAAGRFARPPPPALVNRQVVARTAPPAAPVSFDREQAAIRANGGRPLGRGEMARLQPNAPTARVRLVTPTPQAGRQPAFGRAGAPGQQPVQTGARGPGADLPGPQRPGSDADSAGQSVPALGRGAGADRPGADVRGLTERERALQNGSLPGSQVPRSDRPFPRGEGGRGMPAPNGPAPDNAARDGNRSQNFQTAPSVQPPPSQQSPARQPMQQPEQQRAQEPPAQQQQQPALQQRIPSRDPSRERPDRPFNEGQSPAGQPNRFEQTRPFGNTFPRPQVENRHLDERRPTPAPSLTPPPAPTRFTAPPSPSPPVRVAPTPPPRMAPTPPPRMAPPAPAPTPPRAAPPPPPMRVAPPQQQRAAPPAREERGPPRGVRGDKPKR